MLPNIKKLKVYSKSKIIHAMKVIDNNSQGTCFVVNDKNFLIGVLTDGDIRRALLNKMSTNLNVLKIVNKKFIYLKINYSQSQLSKILKKKSIKPKCIPIIDEKNKLIDYLSTSKKISLAKPQLRGNEMKYVNDCINSGWISSTGSYVRLFEKKFSNYTKIPYSIAVSNGTVALQLALKCLKIKHGDEVLVPVLTFASPVNAIIHSGASPVFVDVNEDTYCIDEKQIEKSITKKTKAIIVVHLYGHPANMKFIKKIADRYNLFIIEDCAEALGSFYNKKHVGLYGHISTFSFFGNKLITTGEGGMVGFKSKILKDQATILRDHGMDKKKKYWHNDIGFNFRLTNLQAAIGVAQIERIKWFLNKKLKLVKNYNNSLKKIKNIKLPSSYGTVINSYWLYTIKLTSDLQKFRKKILLDMEQNNIEARQIFYPMNLMPPYKKYIKNKQKFPVSTMLFNSSLSLPSAYDVSKKDVTKISKILKKFSLY
jgi:perosamine synthetase